MINYFKQATSFRVLELPKLNPTFGFAKITNAWDPIASPLEWNTEITSSSFTTSGNNGNVFTKDGVYGVVSGPENDFDSDFRIEEDVDSAANIQASCTNLFYVVNLMHDIFYKYGFTESAGNFQTDNFGRGGVDNDNIIADPLSVDFTDNANFATGPDGQPGILKMYSFTKSNPYRSSSLDNSVVIHELTHGLSERLTGGAHTADCLETHEARGLSEGVSDTVAMFMSRTSRDTPLTDFHEGWWVVGASETDPGFRKYPFSTNMDRNPLTYSKILSNPEIHNLGAVWASIMNEIYWNLVAKYGFTSNWHDPLGKEGNIVAMRLLVGALKIQSCQPTFSIARKAILQTDEDEFSGKYKCEIWKGFAKRGFGEDADLRRYVDGFVVPKDCHPNQALQKKSTIA